jgi:hypothetical protein
MQYHIHAAQRGGGNVFFLPVNTQAITGFISGF